MKRNLYNELHLKINSIYGHGRAHQWALQTGRHTVRHCIKQMSIFQLVTCLLFLSTSQYIAARTLTATFVQTVAPMQVKGIFNNSNYSKNCNTNHNKQRHVCWQKLFKFHTFAYSLLWHSSKWTEQPHFYVYYKYCGFLKCTMGRITPLTKSLWCGHRIINT